MPKQIVQVWSADMQTEEKMSSETHSCVKSPAFDGKDENWPIFKRKMETHLARLDLTEVLDESVHLPKDDEMGSTEEEKEKFKELKKKNRKAASACAVLNLCGVVHQQ